MQGLRLKKQKLLQVKITEAKCDYEANAVFSCANNNDNKFTNILRILPNLVD